MRNGGEKSTGSTTFRCLPDRPQINIEFQDLSYTVPQGRKGSKLLLRGINGKFQSGQLTAILGPSGAGKSTLLNVLAGYKCTEATTGSILINGKQRNIKQFGHVSRYIMQEDIMQPMLNVEEAMLVAANLKLDKNISESDKMSAIDEILELLNLTKAKSTQTNMLSGGEKKRLSIALELLNNPPVLFLDEPTTGLDDLSCSQCISLLKKLAEGGRTVICSIHTPSARLFDLFDNVYIISSGQCVYQGYGRNLVPFLSNLGLECPKHFNPADFVIEVCSGEYGDHHDKMVTAIENGRCIWSDRKRISNGDMVPSSSTHFDEITEMDDNVVYYLPCWTDQFRILLFRMWTQMWRDRSYLLLRTVLHILIGILNGNLYIGMGKDGSKTIFNYGFYFTCIIFFMYIPMMPVLLQFPKEIQLLRREHFNKWYCLSAYFTALTVSTIPLQLILGTCYLSEVYILSDQPVEMNRILYFFGICLLTGVISESLGLLIASNLSLLNAMFIGPVVTVPLMLLAVYGFGSGYDSIPKLIRFAMHLSYLRYSLEGIIIAMLEGREKLSCPNSEDFCIFTDLNYFIREMGMNNGKIWLDIGALFVALILFRGGSYYLLRQRLTPNKTFRYLQYIGRFVKNQIGFSR